jgi:alpha-L-fucosidase
MTRGGSGAPKSLNPNSTLRENENGLPFRANRYIRMSNLQQTQGIAFESYLSGRWSHCYSGLHMCNTFKEWHTSAFLRLRLLVGLLFLLSVGANSSPTWDELDARTNPRWYDEAKFGIFIHWGLFSVPGYLSPWYQSYWQGHWEGPYGSWKQYDSFVNETERSNFAYQDYAHRFLAELYRPDYWADAFAKSGAQYVVLTSKHHEGYCMWNSTNIATTWNWNVMDTGPRRDLLGDLSKEVKKAVSPYTNRTLKFGIYHSLLEWFNPLYHHDMKNNWTTQTMVDLKVLPELYDLVKRYQPDLLWSDGAWEADSTYWKATEFLSWYGYNSSVAETAVWNDRWGTDATCAHGSYLTCNDRYQPDSFQERKWEDATTMDTSSWGYNRNATAQDFMSVKELIDQLIRVVAYGGNLLLNVAPAGDGTIHPLYIDRLMGIGEWLGVNGRSVYGTRPWSVCQTESDSNVFYTRSNESLFAHITQWPAESVLVLKCPHPSSRTKFRMLGLTEASLEWKRQMHTETSGFDVIRRFPDIAIALPKLTPDILPCHHAWVLEISEVENL